MSGFIFGAVNELLEELFIVTFCAGWDVNLSSFPLDDSQRALFQCNFDDEVIVLFGGIANFLYKIFPFLYNVREAGLLEEF